MLLVGTERLWLCIALCAIAGTIVICLQLYVPDNTGLLSDKSLFLGNFVFNIVANITVLFMVVYYAVGQIAKAEAVAEREYQRSEQLLETSCREYRRAAEASAEQGHCRSL